MEHHLDLEVKDLELEDPQNSSILGLVMLSGESVTSSSSSLNNNKRKFLKKTSLYKCLNKNQYTKDEEMGQKKKTKCH